MTIRSGLHGRAATLAAVAALLGACGGSGGSSLSVRVERSALGVPHITAVTHELAARALGDVHAQDNFCLLQQGVLTVHGERTRVFGPQALALDRPTPAAGVTNLQSDLFHRVVVDTAQARALLDAVPQTRALMEGYVAGINDYMQRTPAASRYPACSSFARPITLDDAARLLVARSTRAGAFQFLQAIVGVAPPTPAALAGSSPVVGGPAAVPLEGFGRFAGSNGWAFGRDAVDEGKSVLLGNPHFPWNGIDRFYQARLTVPGQFDVAGATLLGAPVVLIGYNQHVAWTHTVSTANRFTLHELQLKPGQPTTYIVDGVEKAMQAVTVQVPLPPAAGSPPSIAATFYRTEFGPMVTVPPLGLSWGATVGYAIQDVNLDNNRYVGTWAAMASVRSVRDLRALLERDLSMPYVSTIAADDGGEVLFGDLGPVPRVEASHLADGVCRPSPAAASLLGLASIAVVDGSKSACNWHQAGDFANSLLPASRLPAVIRTDFVLNSNDSYWLTNPAHSFAADLSPLLGGMVKPQGLRTRAGLSIVQQRLAGADGLPGSRFNAAAVASVWARNESQAAKLVLDDLLGPTSVCALSVEANVVNACAVLSAWKRTATLDDRGAPLFREFWRRVSSSPLQMLSAFKNPFDPQNPIATPSGLKDDAGTAAFLAASLDGAVKALQAQQVALDASLREVQSVEAGARRVPVPGGEDFEGVLNQVASAFAGGVYTPLQGTSYLQVVPLGNSAGSGPRGFLTYSQSTDKRSPLADNQLDFFSTLALQPLPDLR